MVDKNDKTINERKKFRLFKGGHGENDPQGKFLRGHFWRVC